MPKLTKKDVIDNYRALIHMLCNIKDLRGKKDQKDYEKEVEYFRGQYEKVVFTRRLNLKEAERQVDKDYIRLAEYIKNHIGKVEDVDNTMPCNYEVKVFEGIGSPGEMLENLLQQERFLKESQRLALVISQDIERNLKDNDYIEQDEIEKIIMKHMLNDIMGISTDVEGPKGANKEPKLDSTTVSDSDDVFEGPQKRNRNMNMCVDYTEKDENEEMEKTTVAKEERKDANDEIVRVHVTILREGNAFTFGFKNNSQPKCGAGEPAKAQ